MKLHRHGKSLLTAAALAAFMSLGSGAVAAGIDGVPPSWLPTTLRLVGIWDVSVTLRNCISKEALATFPATNQFSADGSELEFGVKTPPSSRYPSLGTWRYIGRNSYASAFRFFRFNPDGSYAGTQEVQRTITLSIDASHFSSVASVSIYDPQHHLLQSGCATETATRR